MTNIRVLSVGVLLLAGCQFGAMKPMPERLSEQDQDTVEDMWQNAMDPATRHDRDVLLDVIMAYGLFHRGVDRLDLQAEKSYAGGRAVMVIHYDRAQPPDRDTFSISCFDPSGNITRDSRSTSVTNRSGVSPANITPTGRISRKRRNSASRPRTSSAHSSTSVSGPRRSPPDGRRQIRNWNPLLQTSEGNACNPRLKAPWHEG
jgi:hypothetical protein